MSSSLIYEFLEGIAPFTVHTVKNESDIPAGDENVAKLFYSAGAGKYLLYVPFPYIVSTKFQEYIFPP